MDFWQRSLSDMAMFFFIDGSQTTMPTISDESGVRKFMKKHKHQCQGCTEKALIRRYERMKAEYLDTQRTKPEQP